MKEPIKLTGEQLVAIIIATVLCTIVVFLSGYQIGRSIYP